jgi:hypothetical protein
MPVRINAARREPKVLLVVTPEGRVFGDQIRAWLASRDDPVRLFHGQVENAAAALADCDIVVLLTGSSETEPEISGLMPMARAAVEAGRIVWAWVDTEQQRVALEAFSDQIGLKHNEVGKALHQRLISGRVWQQAQDRRALFEAAERWVAAGRPAELLLEEFGFLRQERFLNSVIDEFVGTSLYEKIRAASDKWYAEKCPDALLARQSDLDLFAWRRAHSKAAVDVNSAMQAFIDRSVAHHGPSDSTEVSHSLVAPAREVSAAPDVSGTTRIGKPRAVQDGPSEQATALHRRAPGQKAAASPDVSGTTRIGKPRAARDGHTRVASYSLADREAGAALDVPSMMQMRKRKAAQDAYAEPAPASMVDCSVFAPSMAAPNTEIFVQVMLYAAGELYEARMHSSERDKSADLRNSILELPIPKGSRVTVSLLADGTGLQIDQPVQIISWPERLTAVSFVVKTPADLKTIHPTVRLACDGAIVGEMRFKLTIERAPLNTESKLQDARSKRYERVFFSYSSDDRDRVTYAAQLYDAAHVPFFQDIFGLDPGQRWERDLYKEIDSCDLFLLFWSKASSASEWVEKEARYALKRQKDSGSGTPEIVPLILDRPPPPAPAFLAHLHFSDWRLYAIEDAKGALPGAARPHAFSAGISFAAPAFKTPAGTINFWWLGMLALAAAAVYLATSWR